MKSIVQYPTKERLKELFDYRDGNLIWKVRRQGIQAGDVLGYKQSEGYIQASVDRTLFMVHRLIWIWHYGDIPEGLVIDHQNENPSDNRIENLQPMSPRKNARRTSVGKSGEKNIYKHHSGWRVAFHINGKLKTFGTFATIPEAVKRRDEIQDKLNLN